MRLRLIKLSPSLLLVAFSCQPALAGEKTIHGPKLVLAMQRDATTIGPATLAQAKVAQPALAPADMAPLPSLVAPAPAPQPNVPCAQTLTAPPAAPLSATLLKWGRQERRAEFISKRRQSQFHPLRRLLSMPGRLILAPYQHPIAADADQAAE